MPSTVDLEHLLQLDLLSAKSVNLDGTVQEEKAPKKCAQQATLPLKQACLTATPAKLAIHALQMAASHFLP